MITPNDLVKPSSKSGYRNVSQSTGKNAYQAFDGRAAGPTRKHSWKGQRRATALEAAQDYCDWYNALPKLTPTDIENPKRKSGYDHVSKNIDKRPGRTSPTPFQAQGGEGNTHGKRDSALPARWKGPVRVTALEAAQDYCDYINKQATFQPARLKTAGHNYSNPSVARDPEIEAALGVLRDARAQRRGVQGYVYAITEEGCGEYVKIGYSVNPAKRVAELQTGNPRKLVLLGYKKGTPADERAMHAKYIKSNVLQEWFKLDPSMADEFKKEVQA